MRFGLRESGALANHSRPEAKIGNILKKALVFAKTNPFFMEYTKVDALYFHARIMNVPHEFYIQTVITLFNAMRTLSIRQHLSQVFTRFRWRMLGSSQLVVSAFILSPPWSQSAE